VYCVVEASAETWRAKRESETRVVRSMMGILKCRNAGNARC
jgi:hypothetical protein